MEHLHRQLSPNGPPAPPSFGRSPSSGGGNNTTSSSTVSKQLSTAAESMSSITAHRRKRLVRSENVTCCHHNGWEAIFRESLLHMAWPISLSLSADAGGTPDSSALMMDFLPLKIRLDTHEIHSSLTILSTGSFWASWIDMIILVFNHLHTR